MEYLKYYNEACEKLEHYLDFERLPLDVESILKQTMKQAYLQGKKDGKTKAIVPVVDMKEQKLNLLMKGYSSGK